MSGSKKNTYTTDQNTFFNYGRVAQLVERCMGTYGYVVRVHLPHKTHLLLILLLNKCMFKRILFVIVFSVTFPIFLLSCLTISITGIVGIFWYIIFGDDYDRIIDFILFPVEFSINLPYKITNQQ